MTVAAHSFEPVVVDVSYRAAPPPLSASEASKEQAAERLQLLQRRRAMAAAEEAEFIVRFAELCRADDDPPANHPGAKKDSWRSAREFPGASEFFVDELAMVLNVGRGTAAFRARRAFTWRDKLPATFAALGRGEIDERRAQELFAVLEPVEAPLARRVDAALAGAAGELSVAKLGHRARALLLELDPVAAEARRTQLRDGADVFLQPTGDGLASIGAELPADEAVEAYELIDRLAVLAKQDGDARPIHRIRTEIYSLLLRAPGGLGGVQAHLTITAALETLEGTTGAPAEVNGHVITPEQLRDLLRRIGALGLHTPDDGSLTLAIHDEHGQLLATATRQDLQRRVSRGVGLNPPAATDTYTPANAMRRFVTTRDRTCRFPHCGQRVGWADLDHVIAHGCGGPTDCTNLCCLCRSHHRLKTFARGWRFEMLPDGTLRVTTPSGITRVTRPPGLRWGHTDDIGPPRTTGPGPLPGPPEDDPAPF